jgi:hypothetical protein
MQGKPQSYEPEAQEQENPAADPVNFWHTSWADQHERHTYSNDGRNQEMSERGGEHLRFSPVLVGTGLGAGSSVF